MRDREKNEDDVARLVDIVKANWLKSEDDDPEESASSSCNCSLALGENTSTCEENATQVVPFRRAENTQLTVFESPAADYFSQRTFKGLNSEIAVEDRNLSILPGMMGIAKDYVSMK